MAFSASLLLGWMIKTGVTKFDYDLFVIGGGVTGLRAALGLAEIGLSVFLVEREEELGGWVGGFAEMYPKGKNGNSWTNEL